MSNFEEKDIDRAIEELNDLILTEVPEDLESLSKFCKKVDVAIKNANDILYGTPCIGKRVYIKLDNLSQSIYITRKFYHKTRDKLIKKEEHQVLVSLNLKLLTVVVFIPITKNL